MHGTIDRQPYIESSQHRGESIGTIRPSGARWTLLLAEDDAIIRRYFATGLRAAGFEVDDVETGTAAWERFKESAYDLLITDNDMPGICGVELFARIRRRNEKIPVILMSGSTTAAKICEEAGFENWRFVSKPFTAERLIAAAIEALRPAKILPGSQRSSTEGDLNCLCRGFGI